MKFRTYLENIAGVGIFPMISLIIFFVFFISLLAFVFRMDKKSVNQMKNIPLNDGIIKKALFSFIFLFLISSSAFAQEEIPEIRAISGTEILLYMLLGVLFFIAVLVVILLVEAFGILKQFNQSKAVPQLEIQPKTHWWKKFAGMGVSISDEKQILIEGHDYDGIQELDNGMPPWLQSLFVGTIAIAIVYASVYFSGFGDLQMAELDKEIATAEIEKKAYMAKVGASMDENTVTLITDNGVIGEGKSIFQEKCIACHGADGGGAVGPNLTDDYWLHGGGIKNLFKVIKYGVPEKGMISWEKQLSPGDIQKVASYVMSIKGTKPANPKEPQGELVGKDVVAAN